MRNVNWDEVILSDICSTQYGYTASAEPRDIGPKFLRITDIVPEYIQWDDVPHCQISDNDIEKYKLEIGDIVIARTGATTGYAKLIKENINSVFASYLVRLKITKSNVDPFFLGILLQSDIYKAYVEQIKSGSAQGGANAKALTRYKFRLPPLPTQKRIADILSAYDDLIENNNRRIALLEQAARHLYKEWFVRFKFPGHEKVKVVDGVPEGWERKTLGEVADVTMGQSPKSEFYNKDGVGLPFHQGVSDFNERYITHSTHCTAENRIANEKDILCSVRAPVGRLNITLEKIVIGRGLCAIKSNLEHQSLLFYQLKNHFFKEDLIGGGAIFASVTKNDLLGQELLVPPKALIKYFQDTSLGIDNQIENLFLTNLRLKEARDIFLPRLINGSLAI